MLRVRFHMVPITGPCGLTGEMLKGEERLQSDRRQRKFEEDSTRVGHHDSIFDENVESVILLNKKKMGQASQEISDPVPL
jgi:hypothetical protein